MNTEAPATSIQHDLLTDYLTCARLAASAAADRLGHDTVLIAVGDITATMTDPISWAFWRNQSRIAVRPRIRGVPF